MDVAEILKAKDEAVDPPATFSTFDIEGSSMFVVIVGRVAATGHGSRALGVGPAGGIGKGHKPKTCAYGTALGHSFSAGHGSPGASPWTPWYACLIPALMFKLTYILFQAVQRKLQATISFY